MSTYNNIILLKTNGQTSGYEDIQSAINQGSYGDMVVVYPGTYDETIVMANGVGLHLLNGAKIINTLSSASVIHCGEGDMKITGNGIIKNTVDYYSAITVTQSNECRIDADYVESNGSTIILKQMVPTGSVYLNIKSIYSTGNEFSFIYGAAIFITGSNNYHIKTNEIKTNLSTKHLYFYNIFVNGGTGYLNADYSEQMAMISGTLHANIKKIQVGNIPEGLGLYLSGSSKLYLNFDYIRGYGVTYFQGFIYSLYNTSELYIKGGDYETYGLPFWLNDNSSLYADIKKITISSTDTAISLEDSSSAIFNCDYISAPKRPITLTGSSSITLNNSKLVATKAGLSSADQDVIYALNSTASINLSNCILIAPSGSNSHCIVGGNVRILGDVLTNKPFISSSIVYGTINSSSF